MTADRFGADLSRFGGDGDFLPFRRARRAGSGGGVRLGPERPPTVEELSPQDRARLKAAIQERLEGVGRQEKQLANRPHHPAEARHWDALVAYRARLERALEQIGYAERRETRKEGS